MYPILDAWIFLKLRIWRVNNQSVPVSKTNKLWNLKTLNTEMWGDRMKTFWHWTWPSSYWPTGVQHFGKWLHIVKIPCCLNDLKVSLNWIKLQLKSLFSQDIHTSFHLTRSDTHAHTVLVPLLTLLSVWKRSHRNNCGEHCQSHPAVFFFGFV